MAAVQPQSRRPALPRNASTLEYARYHRICRDHTDDDPLDGRNVPQAPVFLSQDLAEPAGCPQLQPSHRPDISEKLELNTPALAVLMAAHAPPNVSAESERYSRPRRWRDSKVEPPILSTDPELDTQKFWRRGALCLKELSLPFEYTDEEKDEGLTWASSHQKLPAEVQHKIASDKLDIPKEAIHFLSSVFVPPKLPDSPELTILKRKTIETVTPPLLPLDPVFTQFSDPSSSSPTGNLRLLSEATDSTAVEAEAFDAEILKKDRIGTPDTPTFKHYTEDPMLLDDIQDSDIDKAPSPQRMGRRRSDLKVEPPLTPKPLPSSALRSGSNMTKSVSFQEKMPEYIPDAEELPSIFENGNDVLDLENDFDVFFDNLEPFRNKANQNAEHEQLQEVDTTKRVEVPRIDFEVPVAPWDVYSLKKSSSSDGFFTELEAQKRLLSRCANEEAGLASRWGGPKKEERNLVWSPFAQGVSVAAPAEVIRHDDAVDSIIGISAMQEVDIVDSASLVWKLEGLRILDAIDDEEELLFWEFGSAAVVLPIVEDAVSLKDDIASLAQKRKLEIASVIGTAKDQPESSHTGDTPPLRPQKKHMRTDQYRPSPTRENTGFMLGGIFSTSASLGQFISLQSGVPMTDLQLENTRQEFLRANQPIPPERSAESQTAEQAMELDIPNDEPDPVPLPAPQIPADLPPKPFIISSLLLTQRRNLVSMIQTAYPSAILIERDTTRLLSNPNHPATAAAPDSEADILLSPSTGLLLTTLQKLKQRPLPGQAQTIHTFQARLALVAARFEHLLVLVSEGQPATTAPAPAKPPDPRDCDALASLAGSAAASTTAAVVTVAYVPGGEQVLAAWIVAAMAQHGRTGAELSGRCPSSPSADAPVVKVLEEEETLWELFLRRAGLNAFAAQVVLARLKKKGEDGVYGPREFVQMSAEERRRRFEGVLGGSGVLDRVGTRVDQVWGTPGRGL